ncbi:MAG: helix-turn-helix transcriptional regulator [Clostridiaceae bacterium]|nr:helix-turn-helix transcriptional regulator [Clostridiaceae bacterium]
MAITYLTKIKAILHPDNVVHPNGLRRKNAAYLAVWILYYAWVVAFATWWTASPVLDSAFDTQIRSVMHMVSLLSSAAFVFIIRKEWFMKAARIGAVLVILSMVLFYSFESEAFKMIAAIIGSIAIGSVNISILIPFVFKLNNTEKLYAVVSSNALIQLISLIKEHSLSGLAEQIVSFTLLICSLSTVLFFRKEKDCAPDNTELTERVVMHRRIYLSLLFNCAIAILCKGAGKGILNIAAAGSGSFVFTGYYIGGLAGCVIYIFIYAFTKKAFIWLGNITFSSITLGLLFYAFTPQSPGLAIPFSVFLGLGSTIGMINMYYIIGVIGKKYDSMRYVRMSILFIGLLGGVSGIVVGNIISRTGTFDISISASIVSVLVMIAFMFISPIMERADYLNSWGLESNHTEVGGGLYAIFKPYALSKREVEVCDLLLQGYTLRQISAILPIAYSTVNTYCTSAYRKLGINSRTELLLKFKDNIT